VKAGLVCADSGFYTDEIMGNLEGRGLPYIIPAKAYANLTYKIYGMKDWVEVCPGIAVQEWLHQPVDAGSPARRHIVVRKQKTPKPPSASSWWLTI
jgi:hypothetical protein